MMLWLILSGFEASTGGESDEQCSVCVQFVLLGLEGEKKVFGL